MTDKEKLNKLFALSEQGKAEWWPNQIAWKYNQWRFLEKAVELRTALYIVEVVAEKRLMNRGWSIERSEIGNHYFWHGESEEDSK